MGFKGTWLEGRGRGAMSLGRLLGSASCYVHMIHYCFFFLDITHTPPFWFPFTLSFLTYVHTCIESGWRFVLVSILFYFRLSFIPDPVRESLLPVCSCSSVRSRLLGLQSIYIISEQLVVTRTANQKDVI